MNAPTPLPKTPAVEKPRTFADYLAQAEARQPVEGFRSKFASGTHAQLSHADAMIGYRLDKMAQAYDRAAFQAKWGGK